jgi:hypothetical protein
LKKQTQFSSGQINLSYYLNETYGDKQPLKTAKNKAKQSQITSFCLIGVYSCEFVVKLKKQTQSFDTSALLSAGFAQDKFFIVPRSAIFQLIHSHNHGKRV